MHFKPSLDEPGQLWESWKREVPEIFGNVRFLFILQSFQIKCAPVTGSLIGVGFKAQLVVFTTEYSRKKEFEKKKTRGGSDKIFFILPSIFLKVILKAFCLKKKPKITCYIYLLCVVVLRGAARILLFSGPRVALQAPPSYRAPPEQAACCGDTQATALLSIYTQSRGSAPSPLSPHWVTGCD